MKSSFKKFAVVGTFVLASAHFSTYANKGDKAKDQTGKQKDQMTQQVSQKERETLREVSGRVINTKTVEVRGTDTQNLVAMLKTNKGDRRLVVDLGPQKAFTENQIKEGTNLAAQGRVVEIRGRQFLAADKVKLGDNVINIERAAQSQQHQKMQRQGQTS